MRTDEERIMLLHSRAESLKDQRMMRIWGSVSVLLFAVLMMGMAKIRIPFEVFENNGFTGSSLFGEEAGAYVLVAVISFVAAVAVTVYLMRKRRV